MPTGYTHDVQSGKVTEFRDFAINCARAFGALITMRDEPSDAPIPERFDPRTKHYDESIERAEKRLAELQSMTPDQCRDQARMAYEQSLREWEERREERNAQRARYESMLAKVDAWEPPSSDHTEFQRFMLDQLTKSIEFDCGGDYDTRPTFQPGEEWLAAQIHLETRSIERHKHHRQEEIERTESRNRWLSQLRESLRNV